MSWYQMPVKYQKQMLIAVHSAQYGPILTMGPLGHLDMAMASSVIVFLYSCDFKIIENSASNMLSFPSVYTTNLQIHNASGHDVQIDGRKN